MGPAARAREGLGDLLLSSISLAALPSARSRLTLTAPSKAKGPRKLVPALRGLTPSLERVY